ncbi:MAG: hypothetical protein R2695_00475 [Acidimicrobiales bacterium]
MVVVSAVGPSGPAAIPRRISSDERVVAELPVGARQVCTPFVAVFGAGRLDVGEPFGLHQSVERLLELDPIDAYHHATPEIPEAVEVLHHRDVASAPALVGAWSTAPS